MRAKTAIALGALLFLVGSAASLRADGPLPGERDL